MNTDLLKSRFRRLAETSLPVEYKYDGRTLTAISAAVWQKLKFSEWGVESGYEKSIMAKCEDFEPYAHPELDAVIEIDGQDKRVLNCEVDASQTAVRIDLGPKYAG